MAIARPGATLFTVTENGYGKRTPLDDYRVQSRGRSRYHKCSRQCPKRPRGRRGLRRRRRRADAGGRSRARCCGWWSATSGRIGRATQGVRLIGIGEGRPRRCRWRGWSRRTTRTGALTTRPGTTRTRTTRTRTRKQTRRRLTERRRRERSRGTEVAVAGAPAPSVTVAHREGGRHNVSFITPNCRGESPSRCSSEAACWPRAAAEERS